MSDVHSAAVLLMSLPEEDASVILSKLEPKQVEQVSIEIARLGAVSAEEQEKVMSDFAQTSPSGGGRGGGLEVAKSLLQRALGTNAGAALDNVRQSIESIPFGFLRHVDRQNILTYIVDEHPQTIALVMSHLPPQYGAEILTALPEERRISVVRRIATMGQTNPEIIREVEKGLERRMSSVMSQSFQNAGGVEAVAEMLNVADRTTERALLDKLGAEDPKLVDEIRRLMFVFEDICKFTDKDIQTVLKQVETNQWALALKSASDQLRDRILGNMSERAADMLKEEMGYLGAVKRSAVEAKQQEIVDVIRRLEDEGQIEINTSGEEEEMVA
jgi:flagellar motor switch protein FliG